MHFLIFGILLKEFKQVIYQTIFFLFHKVHAFGKPDEIIKEGQVISK